MWSSIFTPENAMKAATTGYNLQEKNKVQKMR
jgi:hypothetical protein